MCQKGYTPLAFGSEVNGGEVEDFAFEGNCF